MSDKKHKGSCLCKAIKFELILPEKEVHVCHCGLCQKLHGGPGFALSCEKDWVIQGEENLTWYDSSEWAQRSFCGTCGTHLFFRMKDGSFHGVPAGVMDDLEGFKLGMHIFIDKKPDYYDFNDNAPRLTEKEFLEMVGAEK